MESSLSMVIPARKKTPAIFDQNIRRSVRAGTVFPDSGVSARVQPTEPSLNLAGMAFPLQLPENGHFLVAQDPSSLEGENVNGIVLST